MKKCHCHNYNTGTNTLLYVGKVPTSMKVQLQVQYIREVHIYCKVFPGRTTWAIPWRCHLTASTATTWATGPSTGWWDWSRYSHVGCMVVFSTHGLSTPRFSPRIVHPTDCPPPGFSTPWIVTGGQTVWPPTLWQCDHHETESNKRPRDQKVSALATEPCGRTDPCWCVIHMGG